ncbi:MAG: D-2-hydroxyacid dehydrogenase [Firmicutes bacterium]|nr:D-2-hydroxyacid dehydrogenase [Bacillota bacterium]
MESRLLKLNKIVVLDGYTLNPGDLSWDGLRQFGKTTVYDRTPEELVLERIGDAGIILTNKTMLTGEILDRAPDIRYVGVLATGYNVVDMAAAKEKGVTVTNIPAYGTAAVAQMTFALLLEMCHHVWAHSEEVKGGAWTGSADFCFWRYPLIELAGKTMGIIGFGRIGQAVAKIALAMGMKVLVHDPHPDRTLESKTLKYVQLGKLFAEADIISLHCPLQESTEGMINRKTIAMMKDNVMIINTARGPLINEEDLSAALNSKKVAGAALDVLSREPPGKDNPLFSAKNCIITPHISWAPKETRERLMEIAVNNVKQFLAGKTVNAVI